MCKKHKLMENENVIILSVNIFVGRKGRNFGLVTKLFTDEVFTAKLINFHEKNMVTRAVNIFQVIFSFPRRR